MGILTTGAESANGVNHVVLDVGSGDDQFTSTWAGSNTWRVLSRDGAYDSSAQAAFGAFCLSTYHV